MRIDPNVDFDWGGGSPDASISQDAFSVVWSGWVQAQFSEPYTFYTTTDDGVRLWVNNQQIINKWQDQGPTEWSGTINLTAGKRYPIEMAYFENAGGAEAHLSWSSPSTVKAIIPQSQLYVTNRVPQVLVTSPTNNASYSGPASFKLQATAAEPGGQVAQVEFFANANSLGVLTAPPYSLNVSNLAGGSYTIAAVATDNGGSSATNSINITVQVTPTVVLTSRANNQLNLAWPDSAVTYVLQVTDSLVPPITWTPANVTTVKSNGQVTATITPTTAPKFYRLSR